jgi:hypothetical protein
MLAAAVGLLSLLTVAPVPADEPFNPVAAGELPQYIFFNKSPSVGGPFAWSQSRPDTFTAESCREIVEKLGTCGNEHLRVGVSFMFSVLEDKPDTLAESLRRLLAAAQAADVPVLIGLDGQNWWESRSDLWNWWDPGLPGYDPRNRRNVEWTGWGPEHAVKIGWRNWGKQIRVRPAPNIASPRFLQEHWTAYDVLIPIIVAWYESLPADKKYLFGGVKVGWEASINVNAYYYPDGNRIFDKSPNDPSKDPTNAGTQYGWTFGVQPLGYAAVYTSGIKQGGALTKEDIGEVVRQYLLACSREVHRSGVPGHLIFTHQGGTYPPWEKHLSFKPAINEYSIPGWSFYTHDPPDCGSLTADLAARGREQWAASEWWLAAKNEGGWRRRFERTLGFRQCRLVTLFNWERFREIPAACAAVRGLLTAGEASLNP